MIGKLINFLDTFCLVRTFYTRSTDGTNEWEIYWNESQFSLDSPWGLKKVDDQEWSTGDKEWLLSSLTFKKIQIESVEIELTNTIKNMLVLGRKQEEQAKKLLGNNIVEEAIADYDQFANALIEIVSQFVNKDVDEIKESVQKEINKSKPDLKLV